MTSSHRRAALSGLALLAAAGSTAHAQTPVGPTRPVSFGVAGGLSIPTGDAGDVFASGFNVDALVEVQRPASPLAFRFEAGYQRFEVKDDIKELFEDFGGDVDVNARIYSGLANVLYKFPGTTVRPYVLGGVGVFNLGGSVSVSGLDEFGEDFQEEENSGSTTNFGYNVGGGLELPLSGVTAFGEVRFQQIRIEGSSFNIVPIKIGIRF